MPPAGPRAQGWTGKRKSRHRHCLAEAEKEWRVRANGGDDDHQGDEHLENSPHPGAAAPDPRVYGLVAPVFPAPYVLRGRGKLPLEPRCTGNTVRE